MSSFLRIIVTGLIAQDPLTGGFLEDGFIKRTEDRPTTIGLPRTDLQRCLYPHITERFSLGGGHHCALQPKCGSVFLTASGSRS
jgi:hypothetical protein